LQEATLDRKDIACTLSVVDDTRLTDVERITIPTVTLQITKQSAVPSTILKDGAVKPFLISLFQPGPMQPAKAKTYQDTSFAVELPFDLLRKNYSLHV
jgi:hypothetical protein